VTLLDLGVELRQALRSLRRAPGFVAATVATLALGIGAATLMWSVVDGVLLRGLPYPDADRLAQVRLVYNDGSTNPTLSEPESVALDGAPGLAAVAAIDFAGVNVRFHSGDAP